MSSSKSIIATIIIMAAALWLSVPPLYAAEVKGPDAEIKDGNVTVTTGLALNPGEQAELTSGISKEIVFYIDLFRVWNYWPDEFVIGRSFSHSIKCDPIKKEFVSSTLNGITLTEKRFKSCESLLEWALAVKELKLTNTSELGPGDYFVQVTVESRLRRLPPVISTLFFFVKETEFKISRPSKIFAVGKAEEK